MNNFQTLIPITLFVAAFLIILSIGRCHKSNQSTTEGTELSRSRDSLGKETIKFQSLVADYNELLTMKSQGDSLLDEAIDELINTKNSHAIAIAKLKAQVNKTAPTIIIDTFPLEIVRVDTFDNTIHITQRSWPVYISSYSDKWVSYNTIANKDSTKVELKWNNQVEFKTYDERYGFLKLKKRTITEVSTASPYSTIEQMKSIVVERNEPRLAISAQIGYGLAPLPSVYVGVGLSYRLFYIKWPKKRNTSTDQDSH